MKNLFFVLFIFLLFSGCVTFGNFQGNWYKAEKKFLDWNFAEKVEVNSPEKALEVYNLFVEKNGGFLEENAIGSSWTRVKLAEIKLKEIVLDSGEKVLAFVVLENVRNHDFAIDKEGNIYFYLHPL